jgi:MinD superfamily P-loop ATPase
MLNFIKGSIFSRNTGVEAQASESEKDVQVLAVWGSPSSGKTTVSVKLAKHLADKKRNVVLLLCDMTAPMLPCICPPSDLEWERSLGSILAATHVTDTLIKQNCITHKKISYLTLIGMLKGENVFTYPPYNAELATELLDHLRDIAPYVIIDCSSYIANDILSAVALMEADSVLRLVNCDLKSISYLSSQLPLLKDNKWDADKQYKVASNVKTNQASEHIEQVLGNVVFKIPHSDELENQALAGDLFRDLVLKDSRASARRLKKFQRRSLAYEKQKT